MVYHTVLCNKAVLISLVSQALDSFFNALSISQCPSSKEHAVSILLFSSLRPFPLCWLTHYKAQAAFSNASWDEVSSSFTPLHSLWLPLQQLNYLYLVILSVINSFVHAHSFV